MKIGVEPVKCSPIYRPYSEVGDPNNNGYYFVGNHLIFDDSFDQGTRSRYSSTMDFNYS